MTKKKSVRNVKTSLHQSAQRHRHEGRKTIARAMARRKVESKRDWFVHPHHPSFSLTELVRICQRVGEGNWRKPKGFCRPKRKREAMNP